ncbi:hypothetical protein EDD27_4918 [Nonomuraea polychroma]|uniref:Uncharacterized protein n=1 Tax=Nonomuraea polychroma TaxID=46176 RepID=A0A438M9C9_9ACTN|nr:hypothetical protein EDD27_4918 [Nonomuraea polychroma]
MRVAAQVTVSRRGEGEIIGAVSAVADGCRPAPGNGGETLRDVRETLPDSMYGRRSRIQGETRSSQWRMPATFDGAPLSSSNCSAVPSSDFSAV